MPLPRSGDGPPRIVKKLIPGKHGNLDAMEWVHVDSAQLAESGMVVVVIVRWYSHNETARHLVGHLLMVE